MKITIRKPKLQKTKKISLNNVWHFLVNLGSNTLSQIFVLFLILIGINIISQKYFFRFDLTETKLYTLSPGSKNIISSLDDKVKIELYYHDDVPPNLIDTRQSIIDLYNEYVRFSKGKIDFEVKNPKAENFSNDAKSSGLTEVPYETYSPDEGKYYATYGYLGAAIKYKDKKEVINKIDDSNIKNLEYETSALLYKLTHEEKVKIGFLTGHSEYDINYEYKNVKELLEKQFSLEEVSISNGQPIDSEQIKVLVIASPKSDFSQRDIFELEQYLLKGGRILLLVDQYDLPTQSTFVSKRDTNINEFLEKFGINVSESLLLDKSFTPLQGFYVYPFWVLTQKENLENSNPALSNLDSVTFFWASPIKIINSDNSKKITPLVKTTTESWEVFGDTIDVDYFQNFKANLNLKQSIISVLIEGKHVNSFKDQEIPKIESGEEDKRPADLEIVNENDDIKFVVIGDGEFVYGQGSGLEQNKILFMNLIEWLSNSDELIAIRSKNIETRSLLRINESEKNLVKVANITFVPFVLIIFGIIYNSIRRKRKSLV